MGGLSAKRKGAAAEREVAKLIQEMLKNVGDFELSRNLLQTREGGYDLDGLPGVAIEVKRVEQLSIGTWWGQTVKQATDNSIALLVYRQNRKPWTFVMRPYDVTDYRHAEDFEPWQFKYLNMHNETVYQLTEEQFAEWVIAYVENELLD